MIVCHRHRFIFINTRQTSGTAIETALSAFCNDDDIVARSQSANEAPRPHDPGMNDTLALTQYRPADWLRLMLRGRRARLDKHLPAAEIRDLIGEATWNDYFKFCVERDPWDKAVALYTEHTRGLDPKPTIAEYFAHTPPEIFSNFPIYSIDGALAVDRVVRFEHLGAELEAIGNLLNLPQPLRLPTPNTAPAPSHYSSTLGPSERAVIDAACAREIETFGYAFSEVAPEDR